MENLSGSVIKGYELTELINSGGFGAVYRAHQPTIEREVAIKIILPKHASQPEFIRRFETEAQVVARLEHLHIVPLHDYWRDPDGAYLVMRYLRGGSLYDSVQASPLDLEASAQTLDQVASALDLAHRNDVIHRDIKPHNILLDEVQNAYLADFGIAKDLTQINSDLTGDDAVIGSLDYLSPEQARSEPVTPRADIYSLGVTLYEMLMGQHPFHDVSPVERLYKHINDPLPEITTLNAGVVDGINIVIQKATAKNPDHRYADALTMATAFREAAALQRPETPVNLVETLTLREQEILQRIAEGLSNKEIAQELFISVETIKWHRKQLYRKLGVRSRVQAIIRAQELKLVVGRSATSRISRISHLPEPETPYKGLQAFEAADHRDFFGREDLTEKLVRRLNEDHPMKRFLAVLGPSGSGKSSVVKAGLIPAIWRGALPGSEKWFVIEMLPGTHPLDKLEVALMKVAAHQSGSLNEQLNRDTRGLLRAADLILPDDGSELVVVIDQFEEVFTLSDDEESRSHFLDLLYTAVADVRSRVRVIVTLRADFYDRPLHYPDFGELVRTRMETILPLSAKELEQAIRAPVERVQVTFEQGLVAHIVAEMNYQAGALPLLQYALTELFEHREGRTLTHAAYQRIGGAVGALARRADELYSEFDESGQENIRQMFLRLVTLGEGVADSRRRVARSELLAIAPDPDVMDELIDTYAAYRLLALDHDPDSRSPLVEVAHEAILREWQRLREWINSNREEIIMQQQIAYLAEEWRTADEDTSFLARGIRLEQFEHWTDTTRLAMTEMELAFLKASITERERQVATEQARQEHEILLEQRAIVRLRALVGVLVVGVLIAMGLSAFAFGERNTAIVAQSTGDANVEAAQTQAALAAQSADLAQTQVALAEQRADEIQSFRLIDSVRTVLETDPELALALAVEANRGEQPPVEAQRALEEIALEVPLVRRFEGFTSTATSMTFSPGGQTALIGASDGNVTLLDPATGERLRQFEGHSESVISLIFSPAGDTFISGSGDNTLILWDLASGELVRRFEGHADSVRSAAFSPDGQTLLSGSCTVDRFLCPQGEIILWDIASGDMITRVEAHENSVSSVVFSPDGQQALSLARNSVILWTVSAAGLEELDRPFEEFDRFHAAGFSGNLIRASLIDGAVVQLDRDLNLTRRIRLSAEGQVRSATFGSDLQTVALVLSGNRLRITNVDDGPDFEQDIQLDRQVQSLTFSPDGEQLLVGSIRGLTLWQVNPDLEARRFIGHADQTWGLAVSPDGQTLIGGGALWLGGSGRSTQFDPEGDNSLIQWDVETGEIIRRLEGHENGVVNLAISPDGRRLVSASWDETIGVWDLASGELLQRFSDLPSNTIALSPDGQQVFSSDDGSDHVLWDLETGTIIRTFGEPSPDGAAVAFSPDGEIVAGTIPSGIALWDVETGEELLRRSGFSFVWNLTFSPDGSMLATTSDGGGITIIDTATGDILQRFPSFDNGNHWTENTNGIAFSPDGQHLLSGWASWAVVLWDLRTGEPTHLGNHDSALWRVAFTPDGLPVSSSIDGTVRMWLPAGAGLMEWVAANRHIREFTCAEREQFRLDPLCD